MTRYIALLCVGLCLLSACEKSIPAATAPILVQGALQMETSLLVASLDDVRADTTGPWMFWRGTLDGHPVVVSRTRMGTAHAAAATALAIERYHPSAIINTGTAGGHDPSLRVGDLVLGVNAVTLGAYKTPYRLAGAGSNALAWRALDLVERPGDADGELHEGTTTRLAGDTALLGAARRVAKTYTHGRVLEGVIGSSDIWNEELDRIAYFHRTLGTAVEEMETAPAAQIARLYHVPFLGIRAVTANVTNGGVYDAQTAAYCQDFVLHVIRVYLTRR